MHIIRHTPQTPTKTTTKNTNPTTQNQNKEDNSDEGTKAYLNTARTQPQTPELSTLVILLKYIEAE